MQEAKCPKCGSSDVIPDVSVFDPGRFGKGDGTLHAVVDERPNAWLFMRSPTRLRAFGECGYTGLCERPAALLAAYRKQAEASGRRTKRFSRRQPRFRFLGVHRLSGGPLLSPPFGPTVAFYLHPIYSNDL
jgi:hypothetical protein